MTVNVLQAVSPVLTSPTAAVDTGSSVTVTATMPYQAAGDSVQFSVNGTASGSALSLSDDTDALNFSDSGR